MEYNTPNRLEKVPSNLSMEGLDSYDISSPASPHSSISSSSGSRVKFGELGRSMSVETDYSSSTSSLPSMPGKEDERDPSSSNNTSTNIPMVHVESNFVQLARTIMKSTNQEDIRAFLLSYRRFATPNDLYNVWIAFFTQLLNGHKSRRTKELLDSAMNFLQIWVATYFSIDFNRKRAHEILDVIKNLDPAAQNQLKLLLLKGDELYKRSSARVLANKTLRAPPKEDILTIPSFEIAKALTQQEFDVFQAVFPTELLYKTGWYNHEGREKHFPNTQKLINRFNEVSYWVATEILNRGGKIQRDMVVKFIDIAKKCEKLNNFNSLMEIVSGMNNSAVQRLKRLWVSIPDKYIQQFEELEELMMPQNNFKNYYTELSQRQQPILPYFALFLRDFTFIIQGNTPVASDGKINIDVIRMLGKRIAFIQKLQSVPYRLTIDKSALLYTQNLYYLDDDDMLYKLSLGSQPSVMLSENPSMEMLPDLEEMKTDNAQTTAGSDELTTLVQRISSYDELDAFNSYLTDTDEDTSELEENKSKSDTDIQLESPTESSEESTKKSASAKAIAKETKAKMSRTRRRIKRLLQCHSVKVPDELLPIYGKAERNVDYMYASLMQDTDRGIIEMYGDRLLLLSGDGTSVRMQALMEDLTKSFLETSQASGDMMRFDLGFLMGKSDAKAFKNRVGPKSPLVLMSLLGPQLAYSGRGFVELHTEGALSPDDNFRLHFDLHDSIEAHSWSLSTTKCTFPCCWVNAGYTSGFYTECFGIQLTATEIMCKGKGDRICKFIVATPNKIDEFALQFSEDMRLSREQRQSIIVPVCMETPKLEKYLFDPNVIDEKIMSPKLNELRRSKSEVLESQVANKLYRSNRDQINLEGKVIRHSAPHYKEIRLNPERAWVSFKANEDDRYCLTRVRSISTDIFNYVRNCYGFKPEQEQSALKFALHLVNDYGRMLGVAEQTRYCEKTNYHSDTNATELMYGLSVFLQLTGWGKMDIVTGFNLSKNDDFLVKFNLQSACEADSFAQQSREQALDRQVAPPPNKATVCNMVSGFCSGWLSRAFDMKLSCVEASCKAAGAPSCTFLVSTPEKIEEVVVTYLAEGGHFDEAQHLTSLAIHKRNEQQGKGRRTARKK